MLVTKRSIVGIPTEKAYAEHILVCSAPPGYPTYFWPGKKKTGRYYRSAKEAITDSGKNAYTVEHRFNGKAAFFAAALCSVLFLCILLRK